jgi:hypothetical protein
MVLIYSEDEDERLLRENLMISAKETGRYMYRLIVKGQLNQMKSQGPMNNELEIKIFGVCNLHRC